MLGDDSVKRVFDALVSSIALLALSPVLAVIAVAVGLTMGRPVLFRQERAGLHARSFAIVKFRTMTDARDQRGELLPDAKRLTHLGTFLRSTSLDELPELWNVLRGEMSLVGPRPLPVRYVGRYSAMHTRRHDVRPGLTGWAQVNGRNSTTWEDRLDLDVWYVVNRSMRLDLLIMLRTLGVVTTRQGVSADDQTTMPEFQP
jgi:sugar transferase EpsL